MAQFTKSWKLALGLSVFRKRLLFTVVLLVATLFCYRLFLELVEHRPGIVFRDPFLSLFTPVNLSLIAYTLIYGGLILGAVVLSTDPLRLLRVLQAYVILLLLRIAFMYFLPLDPPATVVPMKDPVFEFLGLKAVLTRDLFFSGHIASLFLLGLAMPWRDLRIGFYSCAAIVGLLMLLQHVHYTIDVISAPCVAYAAYGLAGIHAIKEYPPVRDTKEAQQASNLRVEKASR